MVCTCIFHGYVYIMCGFSRFKFYGYLFVKDFCILNFTLNYRSVEIFVLDHMATKDLYFYFKRHADNSL